MPGNYTELPLTGALIRSIQAGSPLTGATIVINGNTDLLILTPAGTIATLTLTLPSGVDGRKVTISSSQAVTALTLNGGTVVNAVTSLTAGVPVSLCYYSGSWYRC